MFRLNIIRRLAVSLALCLVALVPQVAGAQQSGAAKLPPMTPNVNQLGQMEGVEDTDKSGLVVFLFLQVIACVFVAVAMAGHLSLPGKKKT